MKVLIYINEGKNYENACAKLFSELEKGGISYDIFSESKKTETGYDVLFVIGGDGTILRRTEYANKNTIPIIGINTGKLGFLSEFEEFEIEECVNLLKNGELVKEYRATIEVNYNGRSFYALNDSVVSRIYTETSHQGVIISLKVYLDDNYIDTITGDGVIISTPTGSTAYSLSAGGAILAPGINAFSITPIAAHSFRHRPIIYSADSVSKIEYSGGTSSGLFIDGCMVAQLNKGDIISVKKAVNPTVFLRRKDSNFYKRLSNKLKDRS